MECTKIRVVCSQDRDIEGTWNKKDVEDEMKDIFGSETDDWNWLEYVLDRDLDHVKEFDGDAMAMVIDPKVNLIELELGNLKVLFQKELT